MDKNGRISFNLLQRHRSPAHVILFYIFDVIVHRGKSLFKAPLENWREILCVIIGELKIIRVSIISQTLSTPRRQSSFLVKQFGGSRASARSGRTLVTRSASVRRVGEVQGQQIRYRRIHARQPVGCADRGLLQSLERIEWPRDESLPIL